MAHDRHHSHRARRPPSAPTQTRQGVQHQARGPPRGARIHGHPRPRRDPEQEVLLAESVEIALHAVLARLTPSERVAFVLHDIFNIPFASVASILERSTDAAKMLATRARRRLRGAEDPTDTTDTRDRSAIDAFFAAAAAGDLTGVLAVLDPDLKASHSFAEGDTLTLNRDEFARRADPAPISADLCARSPLTVPPAPS